MATRLKWESMTPFLRPVVPELCCRKAISSASIVTGAGVVAGRLREGVPEIDLDPVGSVTPDMTMDVPLARGERALGFGLAGVPHLVVLVDDVETVDVAGRGAALRRNGDRNRRTKHAGDATQLEEARGQHRAGFTLRLDRTRPHHRQP